MKFIMRMSLYAIIIIALLGQNIVSVNADEKRSVIFSTEVICKQPGRYIGWPSIARKPDGELIAVFSGDRDKHVCPWGKTQIVRSFDNGKTWTDPVTVNNTPLDDRDAGIIVTRQGTLLVMWFTSLAFDFPEYKAYRTEEEDRLWSRHADKLSPKTRQRWLGSWVRRSTDDGKTWEEPVKIHGTAPHGPIQLRDGRILNVGLTNWDETRSIAVEISSDDGRTWKRIGTVSIPPGEDIKHFHEPHVVELENGKLVALFRYNPPDHDQNIMRQSESFDGGRTWTTAHETNIWGYPPHLLRLRDGTIIVVYGHRREPFGERACLSLDSCETWDIDNIIELASAPNSDLGYPASVELDDGSIFTVYYQIERVGEKTCLMGTHWWLE